MTGRIEGNKEKENNTKEVQPVGFEPTLTRLEVERSTINLRLHEGIGKEII